MSGKTESLVVAAPAKINLYLEVVGKRADGYHDLQSVVVPISLHDVVTLERTDGVILTSVENGNLAAGSELVCDSDADNLATRAAVALRDATGFSGGARIHLKKNIPVGGGLGGGSSNAAAVLVGLNQLWETGLSIPALMTIGSSIGCDVAAMVYGASLCMEGVGDRILPIERKTAGAVGGWWVLIVNPGFSIATRDIYQRYRPSLTPPTGKYRTMVSSVEEGNMDQAAGSLFNSLQETVIRKYPFIALILESLDRAGAVGSLLCGSGASVFCLAHSREHAEQLAGRICADLGIPVWTKVARTLPDGVKVAHGSLEA